MAEFADGVHFAGSDDVVVCFILLEHEPHGFDVVFGVTPVAEGIEVTEVKFFLQAEFYAGGCTSDFASDEGFAAAFGLVVKEDTAGCVEVVGFAVVDGYVVTEDFGAGIGRARVEGGCFFLRGFEDLAEHF